MKSTLFYFLLFCCVTLNAQQQDYQVVSYQDEGMKAPNTHYIGEAWLNRLISAGDGISYNITKAHFKANSTLDWHKHGSPQVLIYLEGEGYYQERGKDPIVLKAGDIIKCDPGIEHWHSSTKNSDVTYLALYGGESPTTWTEVLSKDYYDSVAEMLEE